MKVIAISNFNDESVADELIEEHLTKEEAYALCDKLNADLNGSSLMWHVSVVDGYTLSRGMEDLI